MILLRFHDFFDICKNKVDLARKLNPDEPILGLYGGRKRKEFPDLGLEHIYDIPVGNGLWKWKNIDIALSYWFRDVGQDLEWDRLNILEWDLLITKPNSVIYGHLSKEDLGLTQLTEESKLDPRWGWVSKKRKSWNQLKTYLLNEYGYRGIYYGAIGGGLSFPRRFIEEYSKIPDEISSGNHEDWFCDLHEETRIPNFAKALGFHIEPNRLISPTEINGDDRRVFSLKKEPIPLSVVQEELSKKNGRVAFHPFTELFQ